jgi:septin family protein
MTQHHNTLEDARNLITSIQENLNQIYAVAPTLNGNNVIHESLIRSAADFKQAAEKLAHPALRIATIGTTSAGKSTLTNALIGRQIAPMDTKEMSAGILHLVHSKERHIKIKGEDGLWKGMDEKYADDSIVYQHIKEEVFEIYHEAKKTHTVSVPEIRVDGELLPAAWTELLELPTGVNFEVYDLPGLNNINDKENLKVIQNYLRQCFSIVVINYSHTDKLNRDKLLNEIKEVVVALGGKTDAMVFVLNAVDLRGEHDIDSVESRTTEFSLAIQSELKLKSPPKLIPVSGRALFYAQCAWGWNNPVSDEPTTDSTYQTSQLKGFRKDCATFIEEYETDDIEIWLLSVKKALKENDKCLPDELLLTENLKSWVNWTWKCSGGLALWRELRQRVSERFAEIVIAPTLIQPLASLEILLSKLDDYSKTQRIANKVDVEKRKQELEQKCEELQSFLAQESQEFEEEIKRIIEQMSSAMAGGNSVEIDDAINSLFGVNEGEILPSEGDELRKVVTYIKNDLMDNLIEPVINYYIDELSTDQLKDNLDKVLPLEFSNAIKNMAEKYRIRAMSGSAPKLGIALRVNKENVEDVQNLESIEKAAHCLFRKMRAGLSSRASYMLQTRDHAMQKALKVLLERGILDIEKRIREELPDAASTLLAIYRQEVAEVGLEKLSDGIFALKDVERGSDTVAEKFGTKGSCFKSERTEDIEYVTLNLPNAVDMGKMWEGGVNKAEAALWNAVGEWFSKSAKIQNEFFKQSLKKAQTHLMDLFVQRLEQSEAEYQIKLAELEHLDGLCLEIKTNESCLRNTANMTGEFHERRIS